MLARKVLAACPGEPDEALQRWREALAAAAKPGGSGEHFMACEPLVNGRLDEAVAVATMLLFFGCTAGHSHCIAL